MIPIPHDFLEFLKLLARHKVNPKISGVSFAECWEDRVCLHMGGVDIPVINVEKLLKNKKASGRAKDLLDFEMLDDHHGNKPGNDGE